MIPEPTAADQRPPLERPRHRLISTKVSPIAEMARWLFERHHIPYAEEPHAPLFHVLATRRAGGGNEVPVVVTSEAVWNGALGFLLGLDSKTRPGDRLLGETAMERETNRAFIETLFNLLLHQVRRYVYYHLLPFKPLLFPLVTAGAPFWERALVWLFYPGWRSAMGRALNFSGNLVPLAPQDITRAFDLVEQRLAGGSLFLAGERPGTLDIIFASLIAPIVFPPNYGTPLPPLDKLPDELRRFVEACRARRAGLLALAIYEQARPQPQVPLPWPRRSGWITSLFGPKLQLAGARLALRFAPRLIFGRFALFSRWAEVRELLSRDLEFSIARVNGKRIDELNGPFVLGMDRGEILVRERRQMYAALATVDLSSIRSQVRSQARELLTSAVQADGRIDVVNGYARLVAARTAVLLFGVRGPSEAALTTSARAAFEQLFLNLTDKPKVRERALIATAPLQRWLTEEIARRVASGQPGGGITGALLARRAFDPDALDDDGVRRNVSGLLIGSIDTTATTVAHVMEVLLAAPNVLAQVRQDLDDPARLQGWCWEALRFWPHNPLLLRNAAAGTAIAGKTLKRPSTVVALTLAAMHDPSVFPNPARLDPTRPAELYLHFGGGLHPCAGRAINAVQVPELVRQLLLFGAVRDSAPQFEGPFVDQLVVRLTRGKENHA